MSSDPAVIASSIAAIEAIVAPVITAFITQRSSYRLKTIELFFVAKSEAYEEVIRIASAFPDNPSKSDRIKLQDVICRAELYASRVTSKKLEMLASTLARTSTFDLDAYSSAWFAALSSMRQELAKYHY